MRETASLFRYNVRIKAIKSAFSCSVSCTPMIRLKKSTVVFEREKTSIVEVWG
jgi:hypothetical protein